MKLVDDVRKAWGWFSVQAMASAVALQGGWLMLPDDLRSIVPDNVVRGVTIAILSLGIVGRLVKQK